MTVAARVRSNFYRVYRNVPLAARPSAKQGQLEGPLYVLAIYCLRFSPRPIGEISERRLEELFLKQKPGLVSTPSPRFLRVRRKPFQTWLLRNVDRLVMTPADHKARRVQRHRRLMTLYAEQGPHFHNPDHRQVWEASQAH